MAIKNPSPQSLKMDFAIQLLLLIALIACYLYSYNAFAIYVFYTLFVFQFLSALVKVFKSKIRIAYLLFCLIFPKIDFGVDSFFFIPICLSVFYFILTILQVGGIFLAKEPINKKNVDLDEIADPDLIIDQISENHKKRSENG